jgi:hypothetical protein
VMEISTFHSWEGEFIYTAWTKFKIVKSLHEVSGEINKRSIDVIEL